MTRVYGPRARGGEGPKVPTGGGSPRVRGARAGGAPTKWVAVGIAVLLLIGASGWLVVRGRMSATPHGAGRSIAVEAEAQDEEESALRDAVRARPTDSEARLALGVHLLRQRRAYASMWALQDALDLRPGDPRARHQLARALIAAHLPRQALAFLARSRLPIPDTQHPTPDIEERRVAAAAYLAMGDPVGAVGMLITAGAELESSAAALLDLGNAQEALGDDLAAENAYRRHLRRAPTSMEGHLALGRVLTRWREFPEAETAFREARRLAPDDPRPLYGAALAAQVRDAAAGGEEATRAMGILRELVQAHPEYGPAHYQLGLWYQRRGEAAVARPHFEAAGESDSGGGDARLRLAEVLAAMGDAAAADYQRGVHYLETQQPRRALAEFQRMAELDPSRPDADVMISTAYAGMEEKVQAAAAARHGLERHPEDPRLLALAAKMLVMADDRRAAAEICRRWQARDARAAEPYHLLASIAREALRFTEAARDSEQAIERDPKNADYRIEAARAYAAMSTPDGLRQAIETLRQAALLAPDDARPPLLLGDLLRRRGDLEAARRAYEHGMDRDPTSRQGAVGLVQLCAPLGKGTRATFYAEIVRALQERSDAAGPLWRRIHRADDAAAHVRLAQLLLEAGDLRQARHQLARADELRPRPRPAVGGYPDRAVVQQLRYVERLLALQEF